MLFRLIVFTLLLAPGWCKLLQYWFLSPLIIRNLRYGKGAKNRNLLDVYLPVPQKRSKHKDSSDNDVNYNNSYSRKNGTPVVIFVSGGAWTIGYKMWSALVARGLARLGILTIVPDYRNFPQGDVEDMMEDIRLAVEWTTINAHRFGGDANKIVLSGQSAGAHITLCLLVSDYLQKKMHEEDSSQGARGNKTHSGDKFLGATDESGSVNEEDESDDSDNSEISDDEENDSDEEDAETSKEVVSGLSIETSPLGGLSGLGDSGELISPLTVEYTTPLRGTSGSGTGSGGWSMAKAKAVKSPRSSSLRTSTSADEREKSLLSPSSNSNSHRIARRRSTSTRKVHADTVDETSQPLHLHSAGSANRRIRSLSSGHADDHDHDHPSAGSGSIIHMIDTYLGAKVSEKHARPSSTSAKIISSTASSLKKKFREQVRRNSDAIDNAARFAPAAEEEEDRSGSSSSTDSAEDTGAWRDVSSAQNSARKTTPRPTSASASASFSHRQQQHEYGATPLAMGAQPLSPMPRRARAATAAAACSHTSSGGGHLQADAIPTKATGQHGGTANGLSVTPTAVAWRAESKKALRRNRKCAKKFCVYSHIKLFIGVSGPYNLEALESHLHQRGLDSRILNWICRGSIGNYSPTTQLAEYAARLLDQKYQNLAATAAKQGGAVPIAPQVFSVSQPSDALADLTPIALFHGSRDASIPVSICTDLSEVLHMHGANALCKIYEGWSHTDAILEAPLSGTMRLFHDMAGVIFAHTAECTSTLGSTNNLTGLSAAAGSVAAGGERLVIPPNPAAQDPDSYICSPLDYVSLFLFPRLFSSGTNTPTTTSAAAAANTSANTSVSGGEDSHHGVTDKTQRTKNKKRGKQTTAAAATATAAAEGFSRSNDPMVSQLLVKIAREINPF